MQLDTNAVKPHRNNAALLSAAAHAIALLVIAGGLGGSMRPVPYRLPGTKSGVHLLTYYAPGSMRAAPGILRVKSMETAEAAAAVKLRVAAPKPKAAPAAAADRGTANSGQSGLGDGNITIALEQYFPAPKPSLDSLRPGTAGDVILTAVIDEHGKIAGLTLLAGLGPAIDDAVIRTVNEWVYTPAMKDGVPVPSVEELHFHYERRG